MATASELLRASLLELGMPVVEDYRTKSRVMMFLHTSRGELAVVVDDDTATIKCGMNGPRSELSDPDMLDEIMRYVDG